MHYHAEVYIPEKFAFARQVDSILRLHNETRNLFDWYQIGGRWKGVHVAEYDQDRDPDNIAAKQNRIKWPTEWKHHEKDIIAVGDLPAVFECYTLIFSLEILTTEKWNGVTYEKTEFSGLVIPELHKRKIVAGYLVTVDYHT